MGKTKHPASVRVFLAISSEGHTMPPHFFKPKEVYLKFMRDIVKIWMDQTAGEKQYAFQ